MLAPDPDPEFDSRPSTLHGGLRSVLLKSVYQSPDVHRSYERVLCVSEISRVRKDMYIDALNGSERVSELPDAVGPNVQLQEKLYVPTKEHPDVSLTYYLLLLLFICY